MAVIQGDGGPNTLTGSAADDALLGLAGNDTLFGNGGRDLLDGGDGFDTADFAGTAGDLDVDLAGARENGVTNSELIFIEGVNGAGGDDAIAGDGGANLLDGRAGDDSLNGAGGDDTLVGGFGGNVLNGGAGEDTASYEGAPGAVLVNLADGFASVDDPAGAAPAATDALSAIERVAGGAANDTLVGSGGANVLLGGGGNDSVSGGAGDDTLGGGAGNDALQGGAGSDTANYLSGRRSDFAVASVTPDFTGDSFVLVDTRSGGEGADTVTGAEFFAFSDGTVSVAQLIGGAPAPGPRRPPTVVGTQADDRLVSTAADDIIDGFGGRDWLDLTAEGRRGSSVAVQSDGTVVVAHAVQTDALYNTEEVRFVDGRVTFDPADRASQVLRLYEAALDRLPDQGGFNFWTSGLQDGASLADLAGGFLGSPEFTTRFGGTTAGNGDFVDRLYLNILGRAGEAEGRQFWVNSLSNGASRADVLVGFSESTENKNGTAPLVQNGVWDRSETATEVARLYDTVFGRLPDAPGLAYWKNAVDAGTITLADAAGSFTVSQEFSAQYGNLGNRDFADALYRNALDRPADAAGLDYWTGQLNAGAARSAVVLAFSESQEHIDLTASSIQSELPAEFGIAFV